MNKYEHLAHAKQLDDGTCTACVITLEGLAPVPGESTEDAMINLRFVICQRLGIRQEELDLRLIGTPLTPTAARLADASDKLTAGLEKLQEMALEVRELENQENYR